MLTAVLFTIEGKASTDDKQTNVAYLHKGMLFSHTNNAVLIHATTHMGLENTMQGANATQKATSYMIPLV